MATISFKGRPFQHDMILQSVRWYLAYSLSGIVNLTRVWQPGRHEQTNTQRPASSLSRMVKKLIQPCGIGKA